MASLLQLSVGTTIVQVGLWSIRGGPHGTWLLGPRTVESTGAIPRITGLAICLQSLPIGLDGSGHDETVCPMDILQSLDNVRRDLDFLGSEVRSDVSHGVPDRILKSKFSVNYSMPKII